MTAKEFIEDTIKFYSEDPSRRASVNSHCYYKEPMTGNRCAVGRCLVPDTPADAFNGGVGDMLIRFGSGVLQEQYRELPQAVLRACQVWHDTDLHFTSTGLTELGQLRANTLIRKYS